MQRGYERRMLGLRSKILLGFSGLLAILIAVSVLGSGLLRSYSDATQRMLRDDLAGVEAAQAMKDALDALEVRQRAAGPRGIDANDVQRFIARFDAGLGLQRKGSTLPAERQATDDLDAQWRLYHADFERLLSPRLTRACRLRPRHAAIRSRRPCSGGRPRAGGTCRGAG